MRAITVLLLLCTALLDGCGEAPPRHVVVFTECTKCMAELADHAAAVQDEAGARAALPKMKEVLARWRPLMREWMGIAKAKPDVAASLGPYGPAMEAATKRYQEQTRRLMTVPGGQALVMELGKEMNPNLQ